MPQSLGVCNEGKQGFCTLRVEACVGQAHPAEKTAPCGQVLHKRSRGTLADAAVYEAQLIHVLGYPMGWPAAVATAEELTQLLYALLTNFVLLEDDSLDHGLAAQALEDHAAVLVG